MTSNAVKVGSCLFCRYCGSLLDVTGSKEVKCGACLQTQRLPNLDEFVVVTRSNPRAFPSRLRERRSRIGHASRDSEMEQGATINEKCPKCGNDEMTFHTMQLRSVDEGQTVFYNCRKCGYKYSVNS